MHPLLSKELTACVLGLCDPVRVKHQYVTGIQVDQNQQMPARELKRTTSFGVTNKYKSEL